MAEEIGRWEIGVDLKLDQLVEHAADTKTLLLDVQRSLSGVEQSTKATASAVTGLAGTMDRIHGAIGLVKDVLGVVRGAFAAVHGVVVQLEGAFERTIGSAAAFSNTITTQASLLGTSIEKMQELRQGLLITTGSAEAGTAIFRRLSVSINSMVGKGGMGPAEAMKRLKVSVLDSHGYLKDTNEILEELRKKLLAIPDAARQYAMAQAIFGRQGGQLLTMFKELTTEGKTWEERLKELGLVIETSMIEKGSKLWSSLEIIKAQAQTTWRIIGLAAAPAFQTLAEHLIKSRADFNNWLLQNKTNIERLAKVVADRFAQIVQAVKTFGTELAKSNISIADFENFLDRVGAAIDGVTILFYTGLKAIDLFERALRHAILLPAGETTEGKLADAMLETVKASITRREEARKERDEAQATATDLEKLIAQHKELAGLPVPRVIPEVKEGRATGRFLPGEKERAAQLESLRFKMQNQLVALRQHTEFLTQADREYLAELNLVSVAEKKNTEAIETKTVKTKQLTAEQQKAEDALKKMLEGLQQERAALLGGVEAKLRMQMATEGLAAASDEAKNAIIAEALSLEHLQAITERVTASMAQLEKAGTAAASRALSIRRDEIDLALKHAEVMHDDATITSATAAKAALAGEERIAKERDGIHELEALNETLAEGGSDAAKIAMEVAVQKGFVIRGEGEKAIADLRDQLATELDLRRDQLDAIVDIERRKAQAAVDEQQRALQTQRSAVVDLKGLLGTSIDEMFEGLILGTKKMSEVWKSLGQSLVKTSIKTFKDMILNKITFLDEPLKLNFRDLVSKLADLFGGLKDPMKGIWAAIFADKKTQEEAALADTAAARSLAEGGATSATGAAVGVAAQTPAAVGPEGTRAIVEAGAGMYDEFLGATKGAVAGAVGGGGGDAISWLSKIAGALEKGFKQVGDWLSQGATALVGKLGDLGSWFGDGLKLVGKGITKLIGELTSSMGDLITTIVNDVGGTLLDVLTYLLTSTTEDLVKLIVTIITTIVAVLEAIFANATAQTVLGLFGAQTGGFVAPSGDFRRSGGRAAEGPAGGVIMAVHPREAVLNPEATAWVGGERGAMALNEGRIPATILARLAEGAPMDGKFRVPVVATPSGLGPRVAERVTTVMHGGTTAVQNDHSVTVHPGAIVVNAPAGVDGATYGRDLMRGILSTFGR